MFFKPAPFLNSYGSLYMAFNKQLKKPHHISNSNEKAQAYDTIRRIMHNKASNKAETHSLFSGILLLCAHSKR